MARPVPVLPLVGSMIVAPGLSFPSRSAASIMASATRSLIEPPGLSASSLATRVGVRSLPSRESRTRGVSPTAARMDSWMPIPTTIVPAYATTGVLTRRLSTLPGGISGAMRNREEMRTQRAQRRLRPWVAGPALGLVSSLALVTAAAGQGGGAASGGDGGGPTAGHLLGGAALLLLVAALVGYAGTAWRRRRAPAGDDSASIARENGLTQMERWVTETGYSRSRRFATLTEAAKGRALGYTTFPERKRAVSPEGRYQARRISAACEARGMVLHQLVGDVQSYSGPDLERPGLTHALDLLANGEASCLVVAGLDRLSTSAANLGTVIEWLDDIGARLVVIDIDLDTETEEGRLAARALARVGALERRSRAAPTPRRSPRERSG